MRRPAPKLVVLGVFVAACLHHHPHEGRAGEASAKHELLAEWQRARQADTPEAWRRFGLAHKTSELAEKAWAAYLDALAREALANLSEAQRKVLTEQQAQALARSRRIGTGQYAGAARDFLLALVQSQPPNECFVITCAKPARPLAVRDEAVVLAQAVNGGVWTSVDSATRVSVRGRAVLEDSSGALFLLEAHKPLAVETPGLWLTGVTGRATLAAREGKGTWIRRDSSDESVLLTLSWTDKLVPAIPAGPGSVLRFVGRIGELYDGLIVEGEPNDPLTFVFRDAGLTYVGGSGRLVIPHTGEYIFPGAITGLSPWQKVETVQGKANRPKGCRAQFPDRVMTVDSEDSLLWLRDPGLPGVRELVCFDLSSCSDGRPWVRVERGAEALRAAADEPDVDVLHGETWVLTSSLMCDDSWVRYWDARSKRSWYRRRSAREVLVRRFVKNKKDAFVRKYRDESWAGPAAPTKGIAEDVVIEPSLSGGFTYEGRLPFRLGHTLYPALPLIKGLRSATKWTNVMEEAERAREIDAWFKKAGVVAGKWAMVDITAEMVELPVDSMPQTVKGVLEVLEQAPHLRRLLADRGTNYVQKLAEVIDKRAGAYIKAYGLQAAYRPFKNVGGVFRFELSEKTPFPLSFDLAVWSGKIKVVPNPDGEPMKWPVDGTHYRLSMVRLQKGERDAGFTVVAKGVYGDGYPRYVATLERQGLYRAGPIHAETLSFRRGAPVGDVPKERMLEFTRFGEMLRLPR